MWTTRHGTLIGPDATVVQVDLDADALGAHRPVDLGVRRRRRRHRRGPARAVVAPRTGYRTDAVRAADRGRGPLARRAVRRLTGAGAASTRARSSIALDDLLPARADRSPSTPATSWATRARTCRCRTRPGFCFTQAFQSIGLGLATAIGAALARPDRLTVAALGDGGALMAAAELETVVRLGLPMVVVVYDDAATAPRCTTSRTRTTPPSRSPTPTSRRSGAATGSRR